MGVVDVDEEELEGVSSGADDRRSAGNCAAGVDAAVAALEDAVEVKEGHIVRADIEAYAFGRRRIDGAAEDCGLEPVAVASAFGGKKALLAKGRVTVPVPVWTTSEVPPAPPLLREGLQ